MKRSRIWIVGILLTATAGLLVLQNGFAPASNPVTQTAIITNTVAITPSEEPCAFVWAYRDAPELTQKVATAVHALNSVSSANAELFGENCVYADGHSTFGAMETDFYVHLPADNLTTEVAFGNWMAQVMPIIVQIPREEIQGNYGFVEFSFEKNNKEHVIVRIPIQQYIADKQEKKGQELFDMYKSRP
jgi:hypothetical protein